MGNPDQELSLKYNPHMIQKQAKKWPVSVCKALSLQEDIISRNAAIWGDSLKTLPDPFAIKPNLAHDLVSEYGVDACRMALIAANSQTVSPSHLESAYKWLAKFYQSAINCGPKKFNITTWLETLYQGRDHLQKRKDPYSAMSLVRKSLKLAKINATDSPEELQLALLSLYPFAPVLSYYLADAHNLLPLTSVKALALHFTDLVAVRFRIKNSGWHWKIFNRQSFVADPIAEFKTVKLVALAAQNRHIDVSMLEEGYEICLI